MWAVVTATENTIYPCRSELARDEFERDALFQTVRVIVHVHREQARSYRGGGVRLQTAIGAVIGAWCS
jgi:hypothetical protein